MCARCDELEAENLHLKSMLGVTENDAIGEALFRAYGLSKTQLRIALLLYAARGRVVNRWAIVALFDKADAYGKALHTHVCMLRRKLGFASVQNESGVGYRLSRETVAVFDILTASAAEAA